MLKSYFYTPCMLIYLVNGSYGQTGSFSGKVLDSKTQEPLIGATVQLDGTLLGAITDANGSYVISGITPDSYNVTASYVGYLPQTQFNVIVRSEGNIAVNFRLEASNRPLEAVVVIADPFQKMEETPLSIQTLTQVEIASYPGSNNDIAKVVQSLPGVSNSVGGFRNDVIIRGGAPNENVYFLDGVEIPTINHFSTQGSAGGPVGLLNVSFFEGVTLTTSAFGAQYDNVLSGVLQFDQRTGNARKFQANVRVSSSETALTGEGPLFKGKQEESPTTYLLSVRRSYLQLVSDLAGLPFLPDYWDYQYKINHKLNEYNDIMLTGVGSIDDFAVNELDEFDPELQAIQDQVPVIRQRTNAVGLTWKKRFKNNTGFMQSTVSTNLLINEFFQFEDNLNETNPFFENDAREEEVKLRYNLTKFLGAWTAAVGFITQQANYSNETRDFVNDFNFSSSIELLRYGLYAQASRSFKSDRLGLSLGLRADGNDFTDTGSELQSTLSPRAAFSYQLSPEGKWTASASVGRYFKIPPYTILGFRDNAGTLVNKSARYIQSDHVVVGVERLLQNNARLTLEGFLKLYDNYPVSVLDSVSLANKGAGFEVLGSEPVSSIGKGRTYGAELLYQQQFTGRYYAIAALTVYRSEFTGFDEDEFISSTWDNGVLLSLTGGYKFGKNWEVSGRFRLSGPTPFAPIDQEATLANYPAIIRDFTRLGEEELDTFSQLDVRIDKKWNFKKFSLDLFLDIQNLLAASIPSEPQFGLRRNDESQVVQPEELVVVNEYQSNTPLPSLGIVLNF